MDYTTNHNEKGYRKIFDDYQSIRSLWARKNQDVDDDEEPNFDSIVKERKSNLEFKSMITNEIIS